MRIRIKMFLKKCVQTIFSIQPVVKICRFGNSVGIKINDVSRFKLKLIFTVTNAFHTREHKSRMSFEILKRTVCVFHQRRIMSGVGKRYHTGSCIENTHPSGDKHIGVITFTEFFVCQSEYLLNTHFHEDHVPGLTWLMHYGFGVGEYLHPYNDFAVKISQVHADAIKEATRRGIPIRQIFDGDELMLGEAVITLIRYDGGKSTNGRSVVARIDFGSASMLLTADIIGDTQTWLTKNRSHLLDVDIVKAPHHAVTPMVTSFLHAASPLAVLITNDFDRVDKARVQMEMYQLPAFYSGEGRVVFETDGDDWYIYQNTGKF